MSGWPGLSISNSTVDLFPINDCDNDGVEYAQDAFPLDASETLDSDGDGIGDNADRFPSQAQYHLDTDGDSIPNAWEIRYGLNPYNGSDAISDYNNNGVSAYEEFIAGTIPVDLLDIDGNGQYDALTDGQLVLRSMFGLTGNSLINGVIGLDATYMTATDIQSRIEILGDLADIDGNGQKDALTDGILVLRYLFGFRGEALVYRAVASDATRKNSADIDTYLEALVPPLSSAEVFAPIEMIEGFGGAIYADDTYTVPTGAQAWAGFANLNADVYPFTFANGGSITFTAAIPAAGADTRIYFRFERLPHPDVDPSFNLDTVMITGNAEIEYTVTIPAQNAANTYESFLLYVVERDSTVIVRDIVVTDDRVDTNWIRSNIGIGVVLL